MRSGIADYSRDLLPHLAQLAEVVLFCERPEEVSAEIHQQFTVKPIHDYPAERWKFDIPIYQMGNNPHHSAIYAMMRRYPGVLVLHDLVVHHFLATQRYARELGYGLGAEAGMAVWFGRKPPNPYADPLNKRLLDLALGVIVHSQYAAQEIAKTHSELAVAVIAQGMTEYRIPYRRVAKSDNIEYQQPNLQSPISFASIGQVTENKRLDMALRVFGRIYAENPNTRFLIVGEAADVDVQGLITDMPAVTWHDYIEDFAEFERVIDSADIVINLRYPTAGETSAAALRALARGKPVIVFDHGWYSELPDTVAFKVPVMDEDTLYVAMQQAIANHTQMSTNAREYIHTHHTLENSARQYLLFLRQLLMGFKPYG